jgi:hypothetical protein
MTSIADINKLLTFAPLASAVVQTLTFFTATVTLIIIYRQLHAALRNVRLSTMMHRRDLYIGLTTSLPEKDVETMLLHVFDHFDEKVYLQKYQGKAERIKSYLLMKRKYLYLLLTTNVKTQEWDPGRSALDTWLRELCSYEEFRDVHASQGHYYPKFKKKVDRFIREVRLQGWALDTPVNRSGHS